MNKIIAISVTVSALSAVLLSQTISAAPLPQSVGQCTVTTISRIGTRLVDSTTNRDIAGSGDAIYYSNGGYQVSYDTIGGLRGSKVGDPVRLCLVSIPRHCPPGDKRGRIYRAYNLRTHRWWTAPDAEHGCGGA